MYEHQELAPGVFRQFEDARQQHGLEHGPTDRLAIRFDVLNRLVPQHGGISIVAAST